MVAAPSGSQWLAPAQPREGSRDCASRSQAVMKGPPSDAPWSGLVPRSAPAARNRLKHELVPLSWGGGRAVVVLGSTVGSEQVAGCRCTDRLHW